VRHAPRCLLHSALVTATWFLLSSSVSAQSVDSVLVRPLGRHSLVRLAAEGARTTGRLMSLGGGTATLETETGRRVIDLSGVDTVWVRGRATAKGAIIGGAVGAVMLGTFAALALDDNCDSSSCTSAAEGGLAGGLVGAATGALLGAGIGALIPKWKRRYP